jgi:hypothetical protein
MFACQASCSQGEDAVYDEMGNAILNRLRIGGDAGCVMSVESCHTFCVGPIQLTDC